MMRLGIERVVDRDAGLCSQRLVATHDRRSTAVREDEVVERDEPREGIVLVRFHTPERCRCVDVPEDRRGTVGGAEDRFLQQLVEDADA
jgi:hypothetical protein